MNEVLEESTQCGGRCTSETPWKMSGRVRCGSLATPPTCSSTPLGLRKSLIVLALSQKWNRISKGFTTLTMACPRFNTCDKDLSYDHLASRLKAALQNDKSVFSCWFVVLVFFKACALSVSMELCINSLHFHASYHCVFYIYIFHVGHATQV